jgi:hypothetical protein
MELEPKTEVFAGIPPDRVAESYHSRKLQALSEMEVFRAAAHIEFTLEELCWLLWRRDKRRFLALANGECYHLRAFVPMFQRKDATRTDGRTHGWSSSTSQTRCYCWRSELSRFSSRVLQPAHRVTAPSRLIR